MQSNSLPQTGFVRLQQFLSAIPNGHSTWWAWIKVGKAPAGTKPSPHITARRVEQLRSRVASYTK